MALTPTKAELLAARDDLIERLVDGKQVDGITFRDILDCHLNDTPRAAVDDVANHLLNMADGSMDDYTLVERRVALERWVRALIERWVDSKPDMIRRLAAEYVREAA